MLYKTEQIINVNNDLLSGVKRANAKLLYYYAIEMNNDF